MDGLCLPIFNLICMEKKILILGIGNTLLGDEGFGPAAVYYLQEHYKWPENVTLVDGATRGLMLLGELLECDLAIILDIALGNAKPGTFYMLDGDDLDKSVTGKYSMHQTGLSDILASCELAGHRPEAVVYAMEPYNYQTVQEHLTEEAAARLPDFCKKVVEQLRQMGIDVNQ